MDMKLSQYAKQTGVSYKTAWRWYKAGTLDAYQTPTGIIIVRDQISEKPVTGRIALYARVSSADQREDLERQVQRLKDYAAAKVEILFQSDTGDELVDDLVSVITSMAARIYGRRQSKRRAEKIKACVERLMSEEEE